MSCSPYLEQPIRALATAQLERVVKLARLDREFARVTRECRDPATGKISEEGRHRRANLRALGAMSPVERLTGVRLS